MKKIKNITSAARTALIVTGRRTGAQVANHKTLTTRMKRKQHLTNALLALALLASTAVLNAEPFLYVSANRGAKLVRIDVANGAATEIGNYNQPSCEAIAISPEGKLFTVTDSLPKPGTKPQLASVDLKTGAATPVGPVLEGGEFMGLGFSPDGVLYGINAMSGPPDEGSLYRFNPETGEATKVGVTGGCFQIMDIAFHPDGTMYGAAWDSLYRIDRNTGRAELVTKVGNLKKIMGLAIDDDGNIYVTEIVPNAPLWRVDPVTGAITKVLDTGVNYPHGLEFIPTPRSQPVTFAFVKSPVSSEHWLGSVDTDLDGSADGELVYDEVPGSRRSLGQIIQFKGDYAIQTPFYAFTARMNIVLNRSNGSIRGNGIITQGWLDGSRVHLEAELNSDGVAGLMRLMPGSAD